MLPLYGWRVHSLLTFLSLSFFCLNTHFKRVDLWLRSKSMSVHIFFFLMVSTPFAWPYAMSSINHIFHAMLSSIHYLLASIHYLSWTALKSLLKICTFASLIRFRHICIVHNAPTLFLLSPSLPTWERHILGFLGRWQQMSSYPCVPQRHHHVRWCPTRLMPIN